MFPPCMSCGGRRQEPAPPGCLDKRNHRAAYSADVNVVLDVGSKDWALKTGNTTHIGDGKAADSVTFLCGERASPAGDVRHTHALSGAENATCAACLTASVLRCEVCGDAGARRHSRPVLGYIGVLCFACRRLPLRDMVRP